MQPGLLRRMRRGLAGMLLGDEAPAAPRPGRQREAAGASDSRIVERRIKAIIEGSGSHLAGHVNLIGLDRIKERYGNTWSDIAERADQIARKAIERRLMPQDVYTPWKDLGYLIIFAALSKEAALVKCRVIADDIAKSLFGEEGAALLEVKYAVVRVDQGLQFTATEAQGTGASPADAKVAPVAPAAPAPAPASAPAVAPARNDGNLLDGMRCVFRPVWDTRRDLIPSYLCVGVVPTSNVGNAVAEADLAIAGDAEAMLSLDLHVLHCAMAELQRIVTSGQRFLLTVPVHFETMSSLAFRRRYLDLADKLCEEHRRLAVIELTGVPRGAPATRLAEMLGSLRSRCRAPVLRLDHRHDEFEMLKSLGVAAIGTDVSQLVASEAIIAGHLKRFKKGADAAGLNSYVRGLKSLSAAVIAVGLGFNYLDGDAVAAYVDEPPGLRRFTLSDLYSEIFAAAERAS